MAMIVGEHDQSFGSTGPQLSDLGVFSPIVVTEDEPKPVRFLKIVDPAGSPVEGAQINVVDDDRSTVIWNGVTDRNGIAVLFVNYRRISEGDVPRRNYLRVVLLPVGYKVPVVRTAQTDVSFYEEKYTMPKWAELVGDTSKIKPDATIKVDKTSEAPVARVVLSEDKITTTPGLYTEESGYNYHRKVPKGLLAFRILKPDGTPIGRADSTLYYAVDGNTADLDPNGVIWAGIPYPVIQETTIVPYDRIPWAFDKPKPDWGIVRVLTFLRAYPYVYDLRFTKDGGLAPSGLITDEELGKAPVVPPKPPAATPAPGPGTPGPGTPGPGTPGSGGPALKAVDDKKKTNPLPYILVGVLVIGAIVLYLRTKRD
jgi:hypothetical protein